MPHITWLPEHMHCPETHVPCPQDRLQDPQCAGSLLMSKHPIGQDTSPEEHWQTPPMHASPGLQVMLPHSTPVEVPPVVPLPPTEPLLQPAWHKAAIPTSRKEDQRALRVEIMARDLLEA
jgi:hypothetical protein